MYVNAAHNKLDLRHSAVANSLLKAGGSILQDECDRVVASRGTIPYWDIATTTGGNLQCQHIIHTVGQQYTGGNSGKVIEKHSLCNVIGDSHILFKYGAIYRKIYYSYRT